MRRLILCGLVLSLAASIAPAAAQKAPDAKTSAAGQDTDIVVEGRRVNPKDLPVQTATAGNANDLAASTTSIADARRFVRCMHADPRLLHEAIDHALNDPNGQWTLNRLTLKQSACYGTDRGPASIAPSQARDCNEIAGTNLCRNVFDRGVLFEYALATYAPDLQLHRTDLRKNKVRRQFLQRELPLNRVRSPDDRRYFDVVSCVVQLHPEMALTFVRLPESDGQEGQLRQLLIGLSPNCFGNAKKVMVDPNQFRVYVAEAVYSWAAAVRGVASLIPDTQQARLD